MSSYSPYVPDVGAWMLTGAQMAAAALKGQGGGTRHSFYMVYEPDSDINRLCALIESEENRLALTESQAPKKWIDRHNFLARLPASIYDKPWRLNIWGEWKRDNHWWISGECHPPYPYPYPQQEVYNRNRLLAKDGLLTATPKDPPPSIQERFQEQGVLDLEDKDTVNGVIEEAMKSLPSAYEDEEQLYSLTAWQDRYSWAPFKIATMEQLNNYISEEEERLGLPVAGENLKWVDRHQRLLMNVQSDYGKPLLPVSLAGDWGPHKFYREYFVEGRALQEQKALKQQEEMEKEFGSPVKMCRPS